MNRCFIAIVVAVSMTAVVFWTNAAHGKNYDKGKDLYEKKCVICHGANGKGDGPAASALSKAPANFTESKFWQGDFVKKITDTVLHGHPPMPAFELSPDEIKSIIGYMEHAFKK